jgi:hypothetical protein
VTSILGLEVTDESVQDDQIFEPLINKTNSAMRFPFSKFLERKAYDRNNVSNYLKNHAIHSGFKTRANTAKRSTNPYIGRDVFGNVMNWADSGIRQMWSDMERGGRLKVEGLFSSVKRIFGESVRASSKEGLLREAIMKFNATLCLLYWLSEPDYGFSLLSIPYYFVSHSIVQYSLVYSSLYWHKGHNSGVMGLS